MRERWARRWVAASTGIAVLLAAALSSWLNLAPAPPAAEPAADILDGARIYREQGCADCHSLRGEGNSRRPLDGVGDRLDATAIRQWIVADPAVGRWLGSRVRARKAEYTRLSDPEMAALIAYLQQAKGE